jgi:hypothetical protein
MNEDSHLVRHRYGASAAFVSFPILWGLDDLLFFAVFALSMGRIPTAYASSPRSLDPGELK